MIRITVGDIASKIIAFRSGAQARLNSWGGPRFWSQHQRACPPPAPGQRPSWVLGTGGGRPLPLWGSGVPPEIFWKLGC